MKSLRIGSRNSRLAMVQAEYVADWYRKAHHDSCVEIIGISTKGDEILDRKLDKIGGKGLFIKELEVALLEGSIDIAVHSAKDLPAHLASGLDIVAVSAREDARDALISRKGSFLADLPNGAVVGTSSARREYQLLALRPDLQIRMLRGNVLTRLQKLKSGEFDAIVLASAGLNRLQLSSEISSCFTTDEMIPAVGQGILAIEARNDFDKGLFSGFHDAQVAISLHMERRTMITLQGDCSTPLGVHAQWQHGQIHPTGFYGCDGHSVRAGFIGSPEDSLQLSDHLAKELLNAWERNHE